jgi:prepilin-type processing-associated H-X9-DG protein/prepilin-type N-terminal cleavage/methylation domain-containing protein
MHQRNASSTENGFTLVELLVVIATVAILGSTVLVSLAQTHPLGLATQCQNNQRQLQTAWVMYAADNSDAVIYNLTMSGVQTEIQQGTFRNWANNILSWDNNSMNRDVTLLQRGLMFPYGPNPSLYRCPEDVYVSTVQQSLGWTSRTRSISMNAFVGPETPTPSDANSMYPTQRQWLRTAEIPKPAQYWVFIEEHPDSINDAYFVTSPQAPSAWGDLPASFHEGAANVAFADGHVETHKWLSRTTQRPVGFTYSVPAFDAAGRQDFAWLAARSSVRKY